MGERYEENKISGSIHHPGSSRSNFSTFGYLKQPSLIDPNRFARYIQRISPIKGCQVYSIHAQGMDPWTVVVMSCQRRVATVMPDSIPPTSAVGTPHHFYNLRFDRHHWPVCRHKVMHYFLANCELRWSGFLRISNISFDLPQVSFTLPSIIRVRPMTICSRDGTIPPRSAWVNNRWCT